MNLETIGWLGGLLLSFCAIPEVLRTLRRGYCDLGLGFLLTWLIGEILLFIYVYPRQDFPLMVNYGVNVVLILILLKYRKN